LTNNPANKREKRRNYKKDRCWGDTSQKNPCLRKKEGLKWVRTRLCGGRVAFGGKEENEEGRNVVKRKDQKEELGKSALSGTMDNYKRGKAA